MDYADFLMHVRMCLARRDVEIEFKMKMAGIDNKTPVDSGGKPLDKVPKTKKGGGSRTFKTVEKIG